MSADTFSEVKLRLESIKEQVESIKYDWYHSFSDEQENELYELVNEIKNQVDSL